MPPKKEGTSLDGKASTSSKKPPPRAAARYETQPEEDMVELSKPSEKGTTNLLKDKKESNYLKGAKTSVKFNALENETTNSPHFANLQTRDGDASSNFSDWIAYKIENAVAADSNVRFYILFGISGFFCVVLAACWNAITKEEHFPETHDFWSAVFMTFQVLITGGYDSSILRSDERIVFFLMIAVGVTMISILIGLITDSVNEYMSSLSAGSTKVVESGHTLILGWNESTTRVICQIAFLRRGYLMMNETWMRTLFPWLRLQPSSPVAAAPIVVMNNTMEKEQMEEMVSAAFAARAINPKRTKIGRDVIFRTGDPCDAHDLVRVAAFKAVSVCVMMSEVDAVETEESEGTITNSATIRTVLALRNLFYSNGNVEETFIPNLRVVVQLSSDCPFLTSVNFCNPEGNPVLFPQDLTKYINTLLFICATRPGLSRVLMTLMNFEGPSVRCRIATQVAGGPRGEVGYFVGKTVRELLLNNCWNGSIPIGCDDSQVGVFDGKGDTDGMYNEPGCAGIMGDPERIIRDDDTIIFVGRNSNPQVVSTDLKGFAKSSELYEPYVKKTTARIDSTATTPQKVLLCGWRQEWDSNPIRIRARFLDIAGGLFEGSSVTCLNSKPTEDMDELLTNENVGFVAAPDGDGWTLEGCKVRLRHFHGDAADFNAVAPLLNKEDFNTAICLGSVVGKNLSAASRDSRILSMFLILRKLSENNTNSMHVIAENHQDQTSMLAVPPKIGPNSSEPDFVNTPAIIARCLVMNLAYPQINDAISELISSVKDSPEVEFVAAPHLGLTDATVVTFGTVQHLMITVWGGRGICIGYANGSQFTFAPPLSQKITFTTDHRLICIIRKQAE